VDYLENLKKEILSVKSSVTVNKFYISELNEISEEFFMKIKRDYDTPISAEVRKGKNNNLIQTTHYNNCTNKLYKKWGEGILYIQKLTDNYSEELKYYINSQLYSEYKITDQINSNINYLIEFEESYINDVEFKKFIDKLR
jgi:hypothetical protein